MTQTQLNELTKLLDAYDAKFGAGKSDEILGAIMVSHDLDEQIKVFKAARGREIVLAPDPDALDGIGVTYK